MALRRIHFDLFLSGLGVFLGVAAFATFTPFYKNYEAGILALYSGILAAITFLLNLSCYKNNLQQYSGAGLMWREIFGFVGFTLGLAFMLFNIFMMLHKHDVPVDMVVRLVWAFMTAKWGFMLYRTSIRYSKLVEENLIE